MTILDRDSAGFPVMLTRDAAPAKEPNTVAKQKPAALAPSSRPSTLDQIEWSRRQDAVREAAREFDDLTEQDLRERFRGLTNRKLTDAELAQLRVDVRAAVIDDLVDVLDQNQRGALRGRRTVRVRSPKGYMRKAMKSLSPEELQSIGKRLSARGWTDEQVTTLGATPSTDLPSEKSIAAAYEPTSELEVDAASFRFEFDHSEDGRVISATKKPLLVMDENSEIRFDFDHDPETGRIISATKRPVC